MHTSWWQFCQNHQVPVALEWSHFCPHAVETKSTNVKSAKLFSIYHRDHYLDAKWKLRIGTDFVIVGHGSYWSSHGELLVWFPFCPFWFAVSIYNLSFFYFSYLLQKSDINLGNPLRHFFCMSPSTGTAWTIWGLSLTISQNLELHGFFHVPVKKRVSFPIPQKHRHCHHGQH